MAVRTLIAATLLCLAAAVPARAQELETYQRRQSDLRMLAGLFGELHHIRRTCEPRLEGDVWRERMKKLLDLEEPQGDEREAMVQAFNKGYRGAQQRYSSCDRRARDYAASRAAQGDAIVARLVEPLRETEQQSYEASPYVLTPPSGD